MVYAKVYRMFIYSTMSNHCLKFFEIKNLNNLKVRSIKHLKYRLKLLEHYHI